MDDVASNGSVILNGLSRNSLETRDLCGDRRLVAAESTEDLLACDCVRLINCVVRAVGRAIVAVETKSAATAEIALGNSACDESLLNDSGRTEQGADGTCAGTSTNLRKSVSIHFGKQEMHSRS